MVVSRPPPSIAKDFVGADDLPELQRGIGIVRMDVGMGPFDGSTECGPEIFSVIARKSPEQIVKRLHRRSRCWISSSPTEISAANLLWRTRTNYPSPPVDNVDPV